MDTTTQTTGIILYKHYLRGRDRDDEADFAADSKFAQRTLIAEVRRRVYKSPSTKILPVSIDPFDLFAQHYYIPTTIERLSSSYSAFLNCSACLTYRSWIDCPIGEYVADDDMPPHAREPSHTLVLYLPRQVGKDEDEYWFQDKSFAVRKFEFVTSRLPEMPNLWRCREEKI